MTKFCDVCHASDDAVPFADHFLEYLTDSPRLCQACMEAWNRIMETAWEAFKEKKR